MLSKKELIGTWKMDSWYRMNLYTGEKYYPFGPNAKANVVFSEKVMRAHFIRDPDFSIGYKHKFSAAEDELSEISLKEINYVAEYHLKEDDKIGRRFIESSYPKWEGWSRDKKLFLIDENNLTFCGDITEIAGILVAPVCSLLRV